MDTGINHAAAFVQMPNELLNAAAAASANTSYKCVVTANLESGEQKVCNVYIAGDITFNEIIKRWAIIMEVPSGNVGLQDEDCDFIHPNATPHSLAWSNDNGKEYALIAVHCPDSGLAADF